MSIERHSNQEQNPNYKKMRYDALINLQKSGGRFRTERTEEIKPGIFKKEYDWSIESITKTGDVVIVKKNEDGKEILRKEVSGKQFTQWQISYLSELGKITHNLAQERGVWKPGDRWSSNHPDIREIESEVNQKNNVTQELAVIQEIGVRELTGS